MTLDRWREVAFVFDVDAAQSRMEAERALRSAIEQDARCWRLSARDRAALQTIVDATWREQTNYNVEWGRPITRIDVRYGCPKPIRGQM